MKTLREEFQGTQDLLVRNIARSLLELEMHAQMTDEELMQFYDLAAGSTITPANRIKLVEDTVRNIRTDVWKLRFYKAHEDKLLNTYGDEDPTGDIAGIAERNAMESLRERGITPESGEAAEGGSGEGAQEDHGPGADAGASGDAQGDGREEPGSPAEPAAPAGGDRSDDLGGASEEGVVHAGR